MAVTTKVQTIEIDRDVGLIIDELLSPAAQSKQFAEMAQAALDDADNENRLVLGRVPPSQTWVDGREGAKLETVRPDGEIVREYELVNDVLLFISAELQAESPVAKRPDKREGHPGLYRASHTLFADGTEVDAGAEIPQAQEYVFLNALPYSRKVERWFSVYESTATKAARRFGNVAKIYLDWRAPAGGALMGGKAAGKSGNRFLAIIVNMGR